MRIKIIMILVVLGLIGAQLAFADISQQLAIEIAKKVVIQFNKNTGSKEEDFDKDRIEVTFQKGKFDSWLPQPMVYKTNDFQNETGHVAVVGKIEDHSEKAYEGADDYWEVIFHPQNDPFGGMAVRVDLRTGQASGPMFLK
jgi:hypothetical protein